MANRLKTILPQLIGPAQVSFVPGRHIIENVIVAQEIIHYMKNKRGKIGQMAIKVDLEKVYDRLSWDFIHETLSVIGLLRDLIRIIIECIITVSRNFCRIVRSRKVLSHLEKSNRRILYPLIFLSSASRGSVTESIRQFGMGVGNQSGLHVEVFLLLNYFLLMIFFFLQRLLLTKLMWLIRSLIPFALALEKRWIKQKSKFSSLEMFRRTQSKR